MQMTSKELIIIKQEPCHELPLQAKLPESPLLQAFLRRRNTTSGEVVANPDWLPSGWITELRIRKSGLSAGHRDKYYFEPVSGLRFRSRAEVMRYMETGLRYKPKGLSNALPHSDNPTYGGCKSVQYYLPVVCESPLYAEHPGLYPVIYFPIIGNNSEDQFKLPPMEFLQSLKDLKPIYARPQNVPTPSTCHDDILKEPFGPQNNQCHVAKKAGFQATTPDVFSDDVPETKPKLDCGLATPGSFATLSPPHENSYPVNNPVSPTSLDLSCNISSFTATKTAGVLKAHLEYSPTSVLENHCISPIASQNPSHVNNPARSMRGQLSETQLQAYSQNLNPMPSTALVSWKA